MAPKLRLNSNVRGFNIFLPYPTYSNIDRVRTMKSENLWGVSSERESVLSLHLLHYNLSWCVNFIGAK